MFRVLMTADTLGGVWSYALDLARELAVHRIHVVLATMGRPLSRDQRQAVRAIPTMEVHESSYRLEWMDEPWRDVHDAGDWLLELAREAQPDLIHLNGYCHAQLPWKKPVLVVAHSDVYSWFRAVRKSPPGPEWTRYRERVSDGLRAADLVVAPSRASLADVLREYGPLPATKVIPNGRDLPSFQPLEKERVILSVGRLWDEAKNIRLLEEAAPRVKAPILAVGNAHGKELAEVKALGELPPAELVRTFGRASIYALPAKYEPFGLSVLEAASSGCALVLGDIPSLRENWSHAAVFVDPSDAGALADALNELLEDEERRQYLAGQARERSKFFSARRMGSAYVQEYQMLAKPALPISQDQFLPRDLGIQEL